MRLTLLPEAAQTFDIKRIGVRISIGRKQGCDILLSDIVVSGLHTYITVLSATSALIEDMSTNGTYVNGVKVGKGMKLEVKAGDLLTLGKPATGGPPGTQGAAVNFKVSFDGDESENAATGVGSMVWKQDIEDLKVLVSQAEHRSEVADRKCQELTAKLSMTETDLKHTKEDNVELVVRNDSMRSEIEQLRARLAAAEKAAAETEKLADTLQIKVDYMAAEIAEIAALKASLNLKHTTLGEEVARLRKENFELNSRMAVSGDVKARLIGNLMSIQQLVGGSLDICQDIGHEQGDDTGRYVESNTTGRHTPPVVQAVKRTRDGPLRGYPVMADAGVESANSTKSPMLVDKFFIGSNRTITDDDSSAVIDGLFPARKSVGKDAAQEEQ